MANVILARNFVAEGAVPAMSLVRLGSADGAVAVATGASVALVGVSTDIAAAVGERCDVILSGVADVVYGGAVTRGAYLTSDAQGRAVAASPTVGANQRVIGMALVSGVAGDVGSVIVSQSQVQG